MASEPQEIQLGPERRILVPAPNAPGFHVHCHPSIVVSCKKCGAEPFTPCVSDRGCVAFTPGMVRIVKDLACGELKDKRDLQKLREYLQIAKTVRQDTHETRKVEWRNRGLNNPRGPRDDHPPPKLSAGEVRALERVARWYGRHG
jgi:hypothetical protein